MLKENICRNRGYILDGYPRNHVNAEGIFTEIDENKAEDDPERLRLVEEIMPNRIISLDDYTIQFLNERAKSMNMINSHYNEEGMKRRIKAYQNMNESAIGELNIYDFFIRKKIDFIKIDCKMNEKSIIEQSKTFLEKVSKIYTVWCY
jgi:adenylate kinase family enzyme